MLAAFRWLSEKVLMPVLKWLIETVVDIVTFAVLAPVTAIITGLGIIGVAWLINLIPGVEAKTLAGFIAAVGMGVLYAGIGSYLFGAVAEGVGVGFIKKKGFAAFGASLGFGLQLYQYTILRPLYAAVIGDTV